MTLKFKNQLINDIGIKFARFSQENDRMQSNFVVSVISIDVIKLIRIIEKYLEATVNLQSSFLIDFGEAKTKHVGHRLYKIVC